MSNWTHAICEPCYLQLNPGGKPVRLVEPDDETCCRCNCFTDSGIYERQDPATMPCRGEAGYKHYEDRTCLDKLMEPDWVEGFTCRRPAGHDGDHADFSDDQGRLVGTDGEGRPYVWAHVWQYGDDQKGTKLQTWSEAKS